MDRQWAYDVPALQDLFKRDCFPVLGIGIQASVVVILDGDQRHLFTCYTVD